MSSSLSLSPTLKVMNLLNKLNTDLLYLSYTFPKCTLILTLSICYFKAGKDARTLTLMQDSAEKKSTDDGFSWVQNV